MTEGTLGERLRQTRKKLGLSQEELAERSGVPQTTISAIETNTNTPGAETLGRLAGALDEPVDYFLPRPTRPAIADETAARSRTAIAFDIQAQIDLLREQVELLKREVDALHPPEERKAARKRKRKASAPRLKVHRSA